MNLVQYQRIALNRVRFELLDSIARYGTYNERKYICEAPDTEDLVCMSVNFMPQPKPNI